jgi:acyl carrier protein
MQEISDRDVLRIMGGVLSESAATRLETGETDQLARLGIDSLSILNIMVTAAEEFGLDLARLDETMSLPVTVKDLVSMLRNLR